MTFGGTQGQMDEYSSQTEYTPTHRLVLRSCGASEYELKLLETSSGVGREYREYRIEGVALFLKRVLLGFRGRGLPATDGQRICCSAV